MEVFDIRFVFVLFQVLLFLEVPVNRPGRDSQKPGGHILVASRVLQGDVDCFAFELAERRADFERQ